MLSRHPLNIQGGEEVSRGNGEACQGGWMSGALKARQDSDRLRPWGPRCQKAEVSESREDEAGSELGSGTGAVW